MKNRKNVTNHLEYLGYTIESEDEVIMAMKPGYPNLEMSDVTSGTVVRGIYRFNENAEKDTLGLFEYLNDLNLLALVATFVRLEDCLGFFATYTGKYRRIEFGQFIQNWEYDVTILLDSRAKTKYYLSQDCPRIDSEYLSLPVNEQYQA